MAIVGTNRVWSVHSAKFLQQNPSQLRTIYITLPENLSLPLCWRWGLLLDAHVRMELFRLKDFGFIEAMLRVLPSEPAVICSWMWSLVLRDKGSGMHVAVVFRAWGGGASPRDVTRLNSSNLVGSALSSTCCTKSGLQEKDTASVASQQDIWCPEERLRSWRLFGWTLKGLNWD